MTPLIIDIAERREVGQTARTRQIASSKGSTSAEKRETGQSTRTGQRTSSKSNFLALSAAFNQLLLNYCSHRLTPQCFAFTIIIDYSVSVVSSILQRVYKTRSCHVERRVSYVQEKG